MKRSLTRNQQTVLEKLRQRGMWFLADETEKQWRRGQRYYLDARVNAVGLRRPFAQGNREATARAARRGDGRKVRSRN